MPRRCAVLLALLCGLCACQRRREVVVFHASSLSRVFGELAEVLQKANPPLAVRLEPSGSQLAARKVAELGLRADVVAVADASINDRLLVPQHAPWNLRFATGELVLAHLEHSRFTQEVTTESWPAVLVRPEVRLGRVDPDLAPLGYHTLLAWQLVERAQQRPGLPQALLSRCAREHLAPDEAELLALLEAKAVDYAFLYRSTAEDHRLKITELPAEANLSHAGLADTYAAASVQVRMKLAADKVLVRGAPILYGISVPTQAPNSENAAAFLEALLGPPGQRLLDRAGFKPLVPPTCSAPCRLPTRVQKAVNAP